MDGSRNLKSKLGHFYNCCEFNNNTIEGFGPFHKMAGIKFATPPEKDVNSKD